MRRTLFLALEIFALVMVLAHSRAEVSGKCAASQAKRVGREIASVKDWKGFHSAFKHIGSCDYGKVAQEYSYAVSRLLAYHWDDVSSLLSLAAGDKEFKQFVLRHIDEDMPEEESQAILSNSRQHCPADGEWLCKAIADY